MVPADRQLYLNARETLFALSMSREQRT